MASHFHHLTVKEIKKETLNTVSIIFNIPETITSEFKYEAGQYLTLKATINGEDIRRSYSISSYTSTDQELQVSCKMIEGGRMSTFLFKELGVDDTLEVMAPMGNFTLDAVNKPLVLFAAGSGITPIISILKKALTEGNNTVNLYYGNRAEEEVIFKSELTELREKYTDRLLVQHFLSSNGERLDSNRTQSLVSGLGDAKSTSNYFVCGPEGMISAVKSGLETSSINANQINIEYFASPKAEKAISETVVSGKVGDIIAEIDGEVHNITMESGESILDAANRIGIDPPFSCQSGVCTTCKCKVMSGTVEMENNFGLGEDEEEEGFVLACISKPTSAGVKVSWDED
ncbi:MAG: 2Fe-2S iron-sulfur cluster binding domain-containing protein [Flavobacteriales bacterium]|nr:2Fe-2S iron-sulfur cluster binding domain-containing protein [Flavobacteriales bacterium]